MIHRLAVGDSVKNKMKDPGDKDYCLASMGIYIFNAKTLINALKTDATDFRQRDHTRYAWSVEDVQLRL